MRHFGLRSFCEGAVPLVLKVELVLSLQHEFEMSRDLVVCVLNFRCLSIVKIEAFRFLFGLSMASVPPSEPELDETHFNLKSSSNTFTRGERRFKEPRLNL